MVEDNTFHTSKKSDKALDMGESDNSDNSRPSVKFYAKTGKLPRSIPVEEPVRATLLHPHEEPSSRRSSFESRRSSAEIVRPRSVSRSGSRGRERRSQQPHSPTRMMSADSQSDWNDHGTESSAAGVQSMDESNVSASQILNRSDVFKAPTSHVIPRSRSRSEESRSRRRERASHDTASQTQNIGKKSSKDKSGILPPSSPLDSILRAGSYPLGRASDLANIIKDQSRRLSTQVTSQSMDYLEKISGMWQAPTRHYEPVEGAPPDDDKPQGNGAVDPEYHSQRFREHFALPDSERLIASYFGSFWRVLPLYGKIYISQNYFCYRSMLPGTRTKLVLPLKDIESVSKKKASYRPGYPGMVITITGHEEIFFDFSRVDARDDCTVMLILIKEAQKSEKGSADHDGAISEFQSLREVRQPRPEDSSVLARKMEERGAEALPILFDDPKASILNFKPAKPLKITCLTIGSRGDVQPYIALALGLMDDGHQVRIATHEEFGPWVKSYGIDFAPVSGDPAALMSLCIQYGMFTLEFLKEAHSHVSSPMFCKR
jgi:sterol 3beta-glucosyltransferase